MAPNPTCLLFLLLAIWAVYLINADDIDTRARKGNVLKLLREMVNQTKADSLNLPANASSIRENITDTFSCENRTYGYYADVDNDCQVFHVCLTSAGSTGRNVTYRWSFICPNETMFNQEVLTCARPRDSIDCEDSPMFYHVNMDIGKVPNDTETNQNENMTTNKNTRRKPLKKQNIIVDKLIDEIQNENFVLAEELEEIPVVVEEVKPQIRDVDDEYKMEGRIMENARLATERSFRRKGRMNRGSFRFKADV